MPEEWKPHEAPDQKPDDAKYREVVEELKKLTEVVREMNEAIQAIRDEVAPPK
jgi:hypothetical protein